MKNKIMTILIMAIMVLSMVGSVFALPDEWGRGVNNQKGDVILYNTEEVGFFAGLLNNFGLGAVSDLESSYQQGETIDLLVYSTLTQTCTGEAYLTLEVYSAPKSSQTSGTYEGGDSYYIGNGKSGEWRTRMSYQLPSDAEGTWSVSGYIWCNSISGPASNYNSPVQERNFQVVGSQPTCSNECSSGAKQCITKNGYNNRYIGTCGNYDSDSCTEYPTSNSDLTDCGTNKVCENGACVEVTTPPPSTTPGEPELQHLGPAQYRIIEDKKIEVSYTLRNIGDDMDTTWILEVQPEPFSIGAGGIIQSVVSVGSQKTCDSNFPQNVHKEFQLSSGASKKISFIMDLPDEEINNDGNTYLYPIITESCGSSNYKAPFYDGTEDVKYKNIESEVIYNNNVPVVRVAQKVKALDWDELAKITDSQIRNSQCETSSECEDDSSCIDLDYIDEKEPGTKAKTTQFWKPDSTGLCMFEEQEPEPVDLLDTLRENWQIVAGLIVLIIVMAFLFGGKK